MPQPSWHQRAVAVVNLLLAFLAMMPGLVIASRSTDRNAAWGYSAGEWLVSGVGGPVRRGLGGTALGLLPGDQYLAVLAVFVVLSVAVPALFGALVARALRSTGSWVPLVWWFVPGGLLIGMWQGQWQPLDPAALVWSARKEYLFYALLVAFVLLVPRRTSRSVVIAALGTLFALALFVHEGVGLLAVLAAGAYLMTSGLGVRKAVLFAIPPTLAMTVIVLLPRPDLERMWAATDPATQSWLGGAVPMSFFAATFDPAAALGLVQRQVLDSGAWRGWLLVALVSGVWFTVAAWVVNPAGLRRSLLMGAAVLPGVMLLATLGSDWGRWIVSGVTLSGIVVLAAIPASGARPLGRGVGVLALGLAGSALLLAVPDSGGGAGFPLIETLGALVGPAE